MGRRTPGPWKPPQGGSFLHSVRAWEGLKEWNGPGFHYYCMTLGQSVLLSDPEFLHLQNGSSKQYLPSSKLVGRSHGMVHVKCLV